MGVQNPALARMVGRTDPQEQAAPSAEPLSPSRRLRGAVMRAADRSIGLSLSVMGVSSTRVDAETLIKEAPEGWVILGLCRAGSQGLSGLVLLDLPLRSAAIEVQTLGKLFAAAEQERPATGLDAEMLLGFVQTCLSELAACGLPDMPADLAALRLRPIPNMRAADLALPDVDHQLWQMSVQIGATERQGNIHLAVSTPPPVAQQRAETVKSPSDWAAALTQSVQEAVIPLEAELYRMRCRVADVAGWRVGMRIDLPGANVAALRLVRAGQGTVAAGRLGQMSGARAIRIEPAQIQMEEGVPLAPASEPAAPPGAGLALEAQADASADAHGALADPDAAAALMAADHPAGSDDPGTEPAPQ